MHFNHTDPSEKGEGLSKKQIFILVAAVLGIALLLFCTNFEKKETDTAEPSVYDPKEDELILYQTYLEERVKTLCESVAGVGKVTAIVTLGGGFESVYAVEEHDGYEQYVILGSGTNAEALFVTRNAPPIVGIGIVCEAGNDALIRQELTELISAAFHVSTNRIHVSAAKK